MIKKGDFELMPHEKIEALRSELARLKGERVHNDPSEAMLKLTETLEHFTELLQGAINEMKLEEREEELIATELRPLHDKIEQVLDQNQKIAQGVVAIADMLSRELPMLKRPSFSLESPPPLFGAGSELGPPPATRQMPLPPPLPPKKGLF